MVTLTGSKIKRIQLVCAILLVFISIGCDKINYCHQGLNRKDYKSNDLKIHGYYYILDDAGNIEPHYVFYRNGVVQKLVAGAPDQELSETEAFWFTDEYKHYSKDDLLKWGVFLIHEGKIALETWSPSMGFAAPLTRRQGIITSDSTFVITSYETCEGDSGYEGDVTFYFKPLPEKPDSNNNVIE